MIAIITKAKPTRTIIMRIRIRGSMKSIINWDGLPSILYEYAWSGEAQWCSCQTHQDEKQMKLSQVTFCVRNSHIMMDGG